MRLMAGMVRQRPEYRSQLPLLLAAALAGLLLLAGCGGIAVPPPAPTEQPATEAPPPTAPARPTLPSAAVHCAAGRLTLGDLPDVESQWQDGLAAATERALGWQADARLVQLQIGCQPLEAGFRWQGTFYSDSAQSYFFSDTGQTEPAEDDPSTVPTLPVEGISFQQLHLTLARAGHADADMFNPATGVTVRLNVPMEPFGPPGTPEDVVYYVAVELQGETRDLFVSQANWTIYSYRDAS